jgi:hypothetical protein
MEQNDLGEAAAYRFCGLMKEDVVKKVVEKTHWKDTYPSLLRYLQNGYGLSTVRSKLQRCLDHDRTEAEDDLVEEEERQERKRKQEEERQENKKKKKQVGIPYPLKWNTQRRREEEKKEEEKVDGLSFTLNQHGARIYSCPYCPYTSGLQRLRMHMETCTVT